MAQPAFMKTMSNPKDMRGPLPICWADASRTVQRPDHRKRSPVMPVHGLGLPMNCQEFLQSQLCPRAHTLERLAPRQMKAPERRRVLKGTMRKQIPAHWSC